LTNKFNFLGKNASFTPKITNRKSSWREKKSRTRWNDRI